MSRRPWIAAVVLVVAAGAAITLGASLCRDIAVAAARSAQGSTLLQTRCGPVEFQQAGSGLPLLVIHGSGGGHDQGMEFARPLLKHGIHVIAISRFGYLRTPQPADASPEAQADAHACVLDALGIAKAAVVGASAGAPSALQIAIRHPARVSKLLLVVPIAYRPDTPDGSAHFASDAKDEWLLRLLGSDVLYALVWRLAPDVVLRHVLATPPELVRAASTGERARVRAVAEHVLPVSARAAGLRDDTRLGKRLEAYPLERVRAPTLVISVKDDGFGTFAGAQYTASRIPGARFVGFETGGHLLVGHESEMLEEMLRWLE